MVITGASFGYNPLAAQGATNRQPPARHGDNSVNELDQSEQREVAELKRRDTEVRAHEAAHMAAGGGLVRGGASFDYEQGPDGKRYAVGGEVSIDAAPAHGDPQATISKAERIRRAALAPADPSAQDRRVAAQAGQMAAEARMELAKERNEEAAPLASSADKAKSYTDIEKIGETAPSLIDFSL